MVTAAKADAPTDGLRADPERLAAIPSAAFPGFPPEPVPQAHTLLVRMLRDAGVERVARLDLPDTAPVPVVFGEIHAGPGRADVPSPLPRRRAAAPGRGFPAVPARRAGSRRVTADASRPPSGALHRRPPGPTAADTASGARDGGLR